METELRGKVALVTGGSRGIGLAISLAFARAGASLAICARGAETLHEGTNSIRAGGGEVLAQPCDVANEDQVRDLVAAIGHRFGRLDILVNNAGGALEHQSVLEGSPAEWWKAVESNLLGTYLVTHLALPLLIQSAPSKIINIGSGMGHQPYPNNSSYSAAKAGVWMFTRSLALEVWQHGIDVNEIVPGPVDTPATRPAWQGATRAPYAGSERIKPPEEVADLALWMATRAPGGSTAQSFSLARRPL